MSWGWFVGLDAKSWIIPPLVDVAEKLTMLSTSFIPTTPSLNPTIPRIPHSMKKRTV